MVDITEFIDKLKAMYPNFDFGCYFNIVFYSNLQEDEGYFPVGITKDEKGVFLTTQDEEFPAHESLVYENQLAKKYGVEVIGYHYAMRIESLDEEEIKVKVGKFLNFMTTCLLRYEVYNPKFIELHALKANKKCKTSFKEIRKKVCSFLQAKVDEDSEDEVIQTYLYSSEGKPLEFRLVKVSGGYNLQAALNYDKMRNLKMLPSIQTLCGGSTNDEKQVMEIRIFDEGRSLECYVQEFFVYLSLASNYEVFK